MVEWVNIEEWINICAFAEFLQQATLNKGFQN